MSADTDVTLSYCGARGGEVRPPIRSVTRMKRVTPAALEHFDRERVGGHMHPRLPDELGSVHAINVWAWARPASDPHFHEEPGSGITALCGATTRVTLPNDFNPDDPDACTACAAKEYERQYRARP